MPPLSSVTEKAREEEEEEEEDYLRERERERWRSIRFNPTANKRRHKLRRQKLFKGIN